MIRRFSIAFSFILALGAAPSAGAQTNTARSNSDTAITHILRLRDGSMLVGRLLARDSTTLQFATSGGVLSIPATSVLEIRAVGAHDMHAGEYWFPDANRTRLFFAPTGRMLEKGEGYYSNTYLLLQNFVGAPSDNFTFGGGFSVIPSDDVLANNVYYLTPKLGVYASPTLNAAVGALAGIAPFDHGNTFGILYGVVTRGGPDASATAGIGYAFGGGSFADHPVLMLGGSSRASRRIAFVTENYAYFENFSEQCTSQSVPPYTSSCTNRTRMHALLSYGLRFMGEKISTDFAFFNSTQGEVFFPGIPYIAFAVKF
jgi:hypothetical protein